MSSYLTIALRPKGQSKYANLTSFSRNDEIYQELVEAGVRYGGMTEEPGEEFSLSSGTIKNAIKSVADSIRKTESRLSEYRLFAEKNTDYMPELLSCKEYLSDLQETKSQLELVSFIVSDIESDYTGFDGVIAWYD